MKKERKTGSDHLPIKALEQNARPRERLLQLGARNLSNSELLAILLGSGTQRANALDLAQKILLHCGHRVQELRRLSIQELSRFHGLGTIKAIGILAALELGARCREDDGVEQDSIHSSKDAYQCLGRKIGDLPVEEFWVIFLNRANRILRLERVSVGGVSATVVDTKVIVKHAVECLASNIILAHNHPSGNLEPSEQDKQVTHKLQQACELLDIRLLDHLIVGSKNYKSFADCGEL